MAANPFQEELDSFKLRLTNEERASCTDTTIKDLRMTIAGIQKQQLSARSNRNITRLRRFIEATDSLTKILDLSVNLNDFFAFIWGPVKYLLLVTNSFIEAFSTLLETYEAIGQQLPLMAQYQTLFAHHGDMRQILQDVFHGIFEFHLRALRFFNASRWKQMFRAQVFRSTFHDIINGMRQHKDLVDRQASLIEFRDARDARSSAERHYHKSEQDERLRRRIFLRDWLNAPNMPGKHEQGQIIRGMRTESGRWLLLRDKFKAWISPIGNAAAALWIHGIPGAGKTILASLVVDECMRQGNTVYFYFQDGDASKDNFIAMARSFLDQLSALEDTVVDILYEAASKNDTPFRTRKATMALLQMCLDAAGSLYVVIDGLDECAEPERVAISRWLRRYSEESAKSSAPTRCVFFSQHDGSTNALLSTLPTIQIKATDVQGDIAAFCKTKSKGIQDRFAVSDDKAAFIAEAVSSRANGMFLYAFLVMDNLHNQPSKSSMQAELDPQMLPQGLDQAYDRILSRILSDTSPHSSSCARKILAWMICARRPLKWREMQCAILIDSETGGMDLDRRIVQDVKDLCGSLVEKQPDDSLTLVHTTAKPFLLSKQIVQECSEHLQLAELCLEQFCIPQYDDSSSEAELRSHVQAGVFAFLDYSVVNWVAHFLFSLKDVQPLGPSQQYVDSFAETLGLFLDLHWLQPKKKSKLPKSMLSAVKSLVQLRDDHKAQMLQVVAMVHHFESSELRDQLNYETLKIYSILRKARSAMELLAVEPNSRPIIEQFYGKTPFKCPRIYCKWFSDGFATAAKRDQHVAKHERAYYCPYFGCAHATLGCANLNELDDHVKAYHKPTSLDEEFTPESTPAPTIQAIGSPPSSPKSQTTGSPKPTSVPMPNQAAQPTATPPPPPPPPPKPRPRRPKGPFTCTHCPRVFVKHAHSGSHMRTHTGERPYKCADCPKSFAREPDLNRHSVLHTGEKKFVCRGTVQSGVLWGCGKGLTRADGLARHFKGDAGKLCIKPQADEEEASRQQRTVIPLTQPDPFMDEWRQLPPMQPLNGTSQDFFMAQDDGLFPDGVYSEYPEMGMFNPDAM